MTDDGYTPRPWPIPDFSGHGATARMGAEELKAMADRAVDEAAVPKKIPPIDDIEAQTKAMVGALSSAMLTATETPITMPPATIGVVAEQLIAYGIRQTEHVDADAIYAPTWITDGVRQEAVKVPPPPQHTEGEPYTAQTATAPKCPKRIPKASRAVPQ